MKRKDVKKYRKMGGGTMRLKGRRRIIGPNEVFTAAPSEIPEAFKDLVKVIEESPQPEKKEAESKEVKESSYEKKDKGAGWFDVVDKDGKVMNEKGLREEDADKLIESLEKE